MELAYLLFQEQVILAKGFPGSLYSSKLVLQTVLLLSIQHLFQPFKFMVISSP